MYWYHVHHLDSRARVLADRHYSRQTPGAREICPPGNKIVLLGAAANALWVSHRPDPRRVDITGVARRDGFIYWDNPYFRNESSEIASELILQALAVTLWIWRDELPRDGFHTFVNPRKVKPTMRRGEKVYGYCFLKAGFELQEERTKARDLLRFVMTATQLRAMTPIEPLHEQLRLFA